MAGGEPLQLEKSHWIQSWSGVASKTPGSFHPSVVFFLGVRNVRSRAKQRKGGNLMHGLKWFEYIVQKTNETCV